MKSRNAERWNSCQNKDVGKRKIGTYQEGNSRPVFSHARDTLWEQPLHKDADMGTVLFE